MSLIEGFFFSCFFFFFFFFIFFSGGGGMLWSYVHHTVKILCSDVVRVVLLIFSIHAIFDDQSNLVTTSRNRRHSTLMPLFHLNTGSIMLLVVMLSIRLFACLPVCLSVHHISICHLTSRVRSISPSPVKAFLQLSDIKMICRSYRYH